VKKWSLLALLPLAFAGCAERGEPGEKPEPTVVKTAVAEEGAITDWMELQGRVAPPSDQDATLAPLVPGRIVFLGARVGESVRVGAVLARVETGALDDLMKSAEAAAKRSQADAFFKRGVAVRSLDLVAKGVAAREEAESAEAAAVAADSTRVEDQAALATARRRRSWAELTAPFAGVVVRIDRRVGDFVDGTPATPVVEVAAIEGWEITASGTASVLRRLRDGQAALIVGLDGQAGGPPLAALITGIAGAIDPATGAGEVRLRPKSRPAHVALGSPVQVRVAALTHPNAILIPTTAVRMAADGSAEVVVLEGGVAHVKKIDTGLSESGRIEVTAGLVAGARVVTEDPVGISDGAPLAEEKAGDSGDGGPGKGEPKVKETPSGVK